MSQQVFDLALVLATPGAAVTATTTGTGVLLHPRYLPTCDWVVYVSGIVATGTYVFTLQVSDLVGGSYTTIASLTWPPGLAAGKMHIPINGDMSAFLDADSRWMRVVATLGGTTPSAVYGSYLAKAANRLGIAARVGDIVTVS